MDEPTETIRVTVEDSELRLEVVVRRTTLGEQVTLLGSWEHHRRIVAVLEQMSRARQRLNGRVIEDVGLTAGKDDRNQRR